MQDEIWSTGIKDLDKLLGGLFIGDNVILETEVGCFVERFIYHFMQEGLRRNKDVIYIAFNNSPLTLTKRFKKLKSKKLTLIDCFTQGKGKGEAIFQEYYNGTDTKLNTIKVELPHLPNYFHDIFDQISLEKGTETRYIFDSVTGMLELWGHEDKIRDFYTHTCPMLFDMKTIAYWVLDKHAHSSNFMAHLEHIGQVIIDFTQSERDMCLRIKKAVERYHPGLYNEQKYEIRNAKIKFV